MIRRVGIVVKPGLTHVLADLPGIASWLQARGVEAFFDERTVTPADVGGRPVVHQDELPGRVDLILLLGGDGTLLDMADRVAQAGLEIPILGVNFGRLGFLTEIRYEELHTSLEAAIAGTAPVESRLMLRAVVERGGAIFLDKRALNDVVVTRGSISRLIEFVVNVDGELVATLHADGIIIATPTGSTAYNLSAGGPIVHPAVEALVLSPIAPHTLTNRPVVIPASGEVVLEPRFKADRADVFVTFDGQTGGSLHPGDTVRVQKAARPVRLVRPASRRYSYYGVLRQKLKWTERGEVRD